VPSGSNTFHASISSLPRGCAEAAISQAERISAQRRASFQDTPNWAAGVVLSWPVMELFATRARARVAGAQVALQDARRRDLEQALVVRSTRRELFFRVSSASPRTRSPALDAARAAETQARARYQAGLGTALEVADAQRLLAQAELEEVSARIGVRRAMLLLARATGDLTPFVVEARNHTPAGP